MYINCETALLGSYKWSSDKENNSDIIFDEAVISYVSKYFLICIII